MMIVAVGALLAALTLLRHFVLPATAITEQAAEAVRPGMTLTEVEGILGPERDEMGGRVIALMPPLPRDNPKTILDRQWVSKRAAITVWFDRDTGRVVDVFCDQPVIWDPTPWERVELWLRDKLEL
jgi:hypothetical protein